MENVWAWATSDNYGWTGACTKLDDTMYSWWYSLQLEERRSPKKYILFHYEAYHWELDCPCDALPLVEANQSEREVYGV